MPDNLILIGVVAGLILFAILVIGFIFSSLYRRATKETAFVRTGLGGEKVIKDGGAIVLPVLQSALPVNMMTLRLEVRRERESALITKDRLRVDVIVEFYVRVQPTKESIANAAQTLGSKTMDPDLLKELVEGKFVDSLRAVAASMAMNELHEARVDFVGKVQAAVAEDLLKNGLELETVSLTGLDQTAKEYFNPDNAFDAEGLFRLTEATEGRRRDRNAIEQDTAVAIAEKNLTAEQRTLQIGRDRDFARLDTEREVAVRTEAQKTEIESQRAQQETAAEAARTESRRAIRTANIAADQKIAISEADSQIAVAKKSEEQSLADSQAADARAQAVAAEERVETARATEIAERTKQIAIIKSREEAESESVGIVVAAQADKEAAENRAEATRVTAQGSADALKISSTAEADAERTRAEGREKAYRVDAEGKKLLNDAANAMSGDQVRLTLQLELIRTLPSIIEQSVKPAEKIDSIRILDAGGLGIGGATAGGINGGGDGSISDQLVNGLLKYRGQAPLVDAMLEQLGLDGSDLSALTRKVASDAGFGTAVSTIEPAPEVPDAEVIDASPTPRRQPTSRRPSAD